MLFDRCQTGYMIVRAVRVVLPVAVMALAAGALSACSVLGAPTPPQVTSPIGTVAPAPTPTPTVTRHPGQGPACPTNDCFTLSMTGDMLFHAGLWKPAALPAPVGGLYNNFLPLLEGQSAYLTQADIAMCHQETPFSPYGGPYTGYPIFSSPPEIAHAAKAIGYDACTTSSNHTIDGGHEGIVRTLDVLDSLGLKHTGSYRTPEEAQKELIMETPAGKVSFIAATFSLNGNLNEFDWQVKYPLDADTAIARAKKARAAGADVVVGVMHAGTEYSNEADIQQIQYARALIDSGEFDLVYGHHPHAIQPMEFYHGKWIIYSLGNGISESSFDYPQNNEFLIVRTQFSKSAAGTWSVSDMAWAAATNKQNGAYKWCSVASDAPQGVCQSPTFDAGVRERTRKTVNAMGAEAAGAHEWLVTSGK
jgi:hypothetical protein